MSAQSMSPMGYQEPPPEYSLWEYKEPNQNTTTQPDGVKKTPWYNPRRWPPVRTIYDEKIRWYNPRGWSRGTKTWIIIAIVVILLVTVVPIEVIKNRYPKYAPLKYNLLDDYSGQTFFDQFNYFTEEDPTKGFVIYVNETTATSLNLTHATDSSAILRVDAQTRNAKHGRNSVRIESKKTYDEGLFIFDIIHTPFGCGTWPALWLTDGYNWPNNGEIDVLETTNEGSHGNEVTLHTTKGCSMNVKRKQTGQVLSKKCDDTNHGNAGCGIQGNASTYGEAMNNDGGGVYALEVRREGIRAWYFNRDSIPHDIKRGDPNTWLWGTALADFPSTKCNIGTHFKNQSIIANIDLCGELAAQPQFYDAMYHCPATCSDFVAKNPASFVDAYWEFKGFKVYQSLRKQQSDAKKAEDAKKKIEKSQSQPVSQPLEFKWTIFATT
ncbi:unnamed protein product [Penicillium bialowiezense]